MWFIPIISGALFRAGGTDQWSWCPVNQKWWRWLMGVPIALIGLSHGLSSLWCILTYYIATNVPYGDKSVLNVLGGYGKWAVYGAIFGLASYPILGYWSIAQAIVSAIGMMTLYYLDEANIVKNPFQEIFRGVIGTILFIFM